MMDDVPRETGDDIDRPDVQGMTMLMWAAAYGQTPTAQLLINHGANVNTAGKELGRSNKKYARWITDYYRNCTSPCCQLWVP